MGIRNAKFLRQRCVRPAVRHGQFAGFRRDNAARHHRRDQITLVRSLAIDQLLETQPPHGYANRLHSPVRQRAYAFEAFIRSCERLATERQPNGFCLFQRKRR